MLVKFNALTGASTSDLTGQKAIDYLNGIDVWKPASGEARPKLTRRARPPIPISGNPALFIATCSVLPFKNRYASGTLAFEAGDIDIHAFEAGDPDIRRVCDALMRDFEETAFAGIPEEHRPHVVWNAHTDKGRLELNFVFARAIDNGDGKLRSFNPKPPGGYADPMWKSFQDLWNNRYAWADPNDPTRARKVKKPKSSHKGPKHDQEGAPIKDIRDVIAFAEGITLEGKTAKAQAIIADELEKLHLHAETARQPAPEPQAEPTLTRKTGPKPKVVHPFDPLAGGNGEAFAIEEGTAPARQRRPFNQFYTAPNASALYAWDDIYGYGTLPSDLKPAIRMIETKPTTIYLKDKSKVQDLGRRITVKGSSEESLRLVIAQAMAKGWTGLSVRGSEEYLRMAARLAGEIGFPIKARDEDMQAVLDEVHQTVIDSPLTAEQNKPMEPPARSSTLQA